MVIQVTNDTRSRRKFVSLFEIGPPIAGRAYNISVQTVSEDETSAPTTAQYRTVPLRPLNVTFDKSSVTSTSFHVFWSPPNGTSEFDKYQVSLGSNRRLTPVTRNRDDESTWEFKDLEPGKTYQVVVKTVSGKVTSWPASGDVTLSTCPLDAILAFSLSLSPAQFRSLPESARRYS